jgi:predicted Rossmann fold flavoprotein
MSIYDDMHDVAVIGAGAAGLAASIFSAEAAAKGDRPQRIVLLDGAKTIGAKILVSGGGRCNVTHEVVAPTDFFGNRHIIKNVLAAFSVEQTVKWFASLGVELKREETGKLFPVTDKARTILTTLVNRCHELGVTIRPDHRVTGIETSAESGFVLQHSHGTLRAKHVILATGGRSIPKSGSDGFGYSLARRLGHHVTATLPALVPLMLEDTMFHKTLSGLSHDVELTTVVKGRNVDCRMGSLLWTHFGISGPVVMDASRFWTLAQEAGASPDLYGNFLPGMTQEQARQWFMSISGRWNPS